MILCCIVCTLPGPLKVVSTHSALTVCIVLFREAWRCRKMAPTTGFLQLWLTVVNDYRRWTFFFSKTIQGKITKCMLLSLMLRGFCFTYNLLTCSLFTEFCVDVPDMLGERKKQAKLQRHWHREAYRSVCLWSSFRKGKVREHCSGSTFIWRYKVWKGASG